MKIAGKEFDFYWKIIKIPFYLYAAWILLSYAFSIFDFSLYISIFSGYSGYIIAIAVFAFVGWTAIKEHKTSIRETAWCGAVLGVIAGILGGVVGILSVYTVPGILEFSLQRASEAGSSVSADVMRSMIMIGSFIGLVVGPIINGLIGAAISSITGLIAKKI